MDRRIKEAQRLRDEQKSKKASDLKKLNKLYK